MNASPERAAQVAVVKWMRLVLPRGSIVFAVKNEHAPRSMTTGGRMAFFAKRKAEGVKSGIPDLGILIAGPRLLMLEMKRPGGDDVLSDKQQGVHEDLAALGIAVGLGDSIESARGFLLAHGVTLREASGQAVSVAKVRRAKRIPRDPIPF